MNDTVYDFSDKFINGFQLTRNISFKECIYGTEGKPDDVDEIEYKRLIKGIKRNITQDHIYNLIRVAQEWQIIRDYFNEPVVVHWGGTFRPLDWETYRGRSGKSQHVLGKAIDAHLRNVPLSDVYTFINRVFKSGGRGMSLAGNFIHKDIRPYHTKWEY